MPETPAPSNSAARPVRRFGKTVNVIIQIALFVTAVVAINYLSCANHKRYDLTKKRNFTLSDFSEKFLNSDILQNHGAPLQAFAVMRRTSPHYSRVYHLLDEYQRLAGQAIELEFIDPLRQTDRTLELEAIYGIEYSEDMIIIDGFVDDTDANGDAQASIPSGTETTPAAGEPTDATAVTNTVKKSSNHVRAIRISDLYLQDDNQTIVAWQDEDIITSNLISSIEGSPRKIYLAADKMDLQAEDGEPAWIILARILLQQNIELRPIRLADIDTIPEDAEALALIGPTYDLNEREMKILTEYWDRQQSALLVTLDPTAQLDNLRIFLRSYGITARSDRIITVKNGQTLSNVQCIFSRGAEINNSLEGKSTVFEGVSCSLEVRENDDRLLNKRIQPIGLAQAVSGWWGETRFDEQSPLFNPEEDYAEPLFLSAAVIRGQATSDDTANLVSKMVVIGNTDFLADRKTRPEQADFIQSSINWLIGREQLIGIGPKKLYRHKMTILPAHNAFITKLVLIFIPAAAILLALIVWNTRRA
ncbi:MAG: Gldg family protein [Akkermansiaceae bacterium]|nr:Gldg family protein [Akkermansiaceae bacterium]